MHELNNLCAGSLNFYAISGRAEWQGSVPESIRSAASSAIARVLLLLSNPRRAWKAVSSTVV